MEEQITGLRRSARNTRILAALAGAAASGNLWLASNGEPLVGLVGFAATLVCAYWLLEIANRSQDKADELSQRDGQLRKIKGEPADE